MIIYAGIDGTSDEKEDAYKVTFQESFVNVLSRSSIVRFSDAFYHRGPFTAGIETRAYAQMAFTWVVSKWKAGQAKGVFLAGYSRGAAAMIEVAYLLKPLGIPVECLILFDAVDRSTPGPGGGVGGVFQNRKIADNVRQTIHPMRDIPATHSRISFQRCGQTQENTGMPHAKEYFFATHGGVGGTPWKVATNPYTEEPRETIWEWGEAIPTNVTPEMDRSGAAAVRNWVYPQIDLAYRQCKARLEAPSDAPPYGPPDKSPYGPPDRPSYGPPDKPQYGAPPRNGQRIHVVQPGDWLSKIAIKYYGDMNKWSVIYNQPQNRQTIGPNPDLIKPGQNLVIP